MIPGMVLRGCLWLQVVGLRDIDADNAEMSRWTTPHFFVCIILLPFPPHVSRVLDREFDLHPFRQSAGSIV